jgi:hypothetical protein
VTISKPDICILDIQVPDNRIPKPFISGDICVLFSKNTNNPISGLVFKWFASLDRFIQKKIFIMIYGLC